MIKEGDWVHVRFWPMTNDIVGEVTYCPQATGDSWVIVTAEGTTFYVQSFASMEKLDYDKETA